MCSGSSSESGPWPGDVAREGQGQGQGQGLLVDVVGRDATLAPGESWALTSVV